MQDLCKEIWVVVKNLFPMVEGVRFEQMWAVINKRGDWNIIHQHGRYEISGGYYLQVSPNCGKIAFRDPRSAAPGNYFLNHFKDKGDVIWYTPKECDLMLWPSFLDHFVEPSQSDNDRIMISFDMMVNHSS